MVGLSSATFQPLAEAGSPASGKEEIPDTPNARIERLLRSGVAESARMSYQKPLIFELCQIIQGLVL